MKGKKLVDVNPGVVGIGLELNLNELHALDHITSLAEQELNTIRAGGNTDGDNISRLIVFSTKITHPVVDLHDAFETMFNDNDDILGHKMNGSKTSED